MIDRNKTEEEKKVRFEDDSYNNKPMRPNAIICLKCFAWLNLILGTIASIYIWKEYAYVFGGGDYFTNPKAIIIAFAVFFQGVFLCSLFLVIANAGKCLSDIYTKINTLSTLK